jgi:chromosome segregation ATPase
MEQLTALDVDPGDKDSATRYLISVKSKLAHEKSARKEAHVEVKALAWAIGDLNEKADKFTAQVPTLDEKVLDGLNKLQSKELSLEQTTKANEEYRSQNARLTKKLESNLSSPSPPGSCPLYLSSILIKG